MNNAYIKLKGIAIAIAMGLLVYLILNGVRLAERYVKAIESGERYFVPNDNHGVLIDKEEKVFYLLDKETGKFVKLRD